jgi:hypothetical protein
MFITPGKSTHGACGIANEEKIPQRRPSGTRLQIPMHGFGGSPAGGQRPLNARQAAKFAANENTRPNPVV